MRVLDLTVICLLFIVGAHGLWRGDNWLHDDPLKCLQCTMVTRADQCSTSVDCDDGESCYIKTDTNGQVKAGCKLGTDCFFHKGPNEECCSNEDNCNKQLLKNALNGGETGQPVVATAKPTPKPGQTPSGTTTSSATDVTPPFILDTGLSCHVCSGGQCGLADETVMKCPDHFPYYALNGGETGQPVVATAKPTPKPGQTPSGTTTSSATDVTPPFILDTGLSCHVCSGGQCGLADETVMKCPDHFPYCMNTVLNDKNGNKYITKRCSSFSECYATKTMERYTNSSEICERYDGAEIYARNFECSFCCETSLCNKDFVPPLNTRVMGH